MFSWWNAWFYSSAITAFMTFIWDLHIFPSSYYRSCFYNHYTAFMIDTLSSARVATARLTILRRLVLAKASFDLNKRQISCSLGGCGQTGLQLHAISNSLIPYLLGEFVALPKLCSLFPTKMAAVLQAIKHEKTDGQRSVTNLSRCHKREVQSHPLVRIAD